MTDEAVTETNDLPTPVEVVPRRFRPGRKFENREKKREFKRKQLRLKREEHQNKLNDKFKARRADLNVIMVRGEDNELVLGLRRGLFGHPAAPILRLQSEDIVGACERGEEGIKAFGAMLTKVGLLAMSQLVGHNLAYGTEDLARNIAKWAGIDLKALEAAAKEENDFNGNPGPGDERPGGGQGNHPVRGDSEQQAETADNHPVGPDESPVE